MPSSTPGKRPSRAVLVLLLLASFTLITLDARGGEDSPLDVLGAETEGAIGYMIEQELGNLLPFEQPLATLLTMVEVDPDDPAFQQAQEACEDKMPGRPREDG